MELFNSVSGILITSLVVVAVAGWIIMLVRLLRGLPLLRCEPRLPVPWGLLDVVIAMLLWFGSAAVGGVIAALASGATGGDLTSFSPDTLANIILVSSLGSVGGTIVAAVFIAFKNRTTALDFGVRIRGMARDVYLGVYAFLLLAGPVYLIQAFFVQWWPSEHPLIELVLKNPSPKFFVVTTISAVLIAPLVEEFIFRVLLQGWLENIHESGNDPAQLLLGRLPAALDPLPPSAPSEDRAEAAFESPDARFSERGSSETEAPRGTVQIGGTVQSGTVQIEPSSDNPYAPPLAYREPPPDDDQAAGLDRTTRRPKMWPIFVSAILFALMHFSHGPDMFALTVLAIGLGFLYQRTHRVLPCIIVHFLLNAVSIGLLALEAFGGGS